MAKHVLLERFTSSDLDYTKVLATILSIIEEG